MQIYLAGRGSRIRRKFVLALCLVVWACLVDFTARLPLDLAIFGFNVLRPHCATVGNQQSRQRSDRDTAGYSGRDQSKHGETLLSVQQHI